MKSFHLRLFIVHCSSFIVFASVFAAGNIDPTNKYAWAENAGWHNYAPTHGGATVHPNGTNGYLSGYVWAESIGWIKLGAGAGPYANTAADNYGVNMDAAGNLSGFAWSEVGGWINFHPTDGRVTINLTTGSFDGYAWSEFSGWIHFKNDSPAYNVCMIIEPPADGWLAIQVTPSSGSWTLTAPAGYTNSTSGTGNLAAVSAVTGGYEIAYGALSGYMAPSNMAGFVTAGSTTLFSAVYLQISTNIGTPTGVSATEGAYTNKIRVTWNGVEGATCYEIWRSRTNDSSTAVRIAEVPVQPFGFSYYYDDYNVNAIDAYYYWVRARTSSLISPMSYVGMGYAALDPHGAGGAADISVSDLVYLPVNATNLSCAGTVSCRLANLGPDALNASGVAFDFHMGTNSANMVWIGSAQDNYTLATGAEKLAILSPTAKQRLTVRGDLSGIQTVRVTVRHMSALNDPNPANNTTTAAGLVRIKTSGVNSIGRGLNDYDGDGKADGCLYRSVLGRWYEALSGRRYSEPAGIGDVGMGWTPAPGDYDGDGITDLAAYNGLNGQWLVRFSSNCRVAVCQYGGPEFTANQSDIDGDAKTDPVIYRETDGYWMGAASSRGYASCYASLGETGCRPVMADYDGDGLADPAVYYGEAGLWGIALSGSGYRLLSGLFGGIGYLPVPADYDGDGLVDPAVYAPATAYWQVLLSSSLAAHGCYTWWGGVAGDINGMPVPSDYDGDGKADLAVYYRDSSLWELFLSARGYLRFSGDWGGPEYAPVME